jgi:(2R)-ethylmalonyl-CoA mutase
LREVWGEYRAPTGIAQAAAPRAADELARLRARVGEVSERLGRRLKMLVGKPGLDGHSSGAEQVALKARDAGFEVVYEGIRLTPAQIVNAALEEGVHVVGLSILSGSHVALVGEVLRGLAAQGLGHVPVVVGGIIPPEDEAALRRQGVARVYTPKDYDLTRIIGDIVELVAAEPRLAA